MKRLLILFVLCTTPAYGQIRAFPSCPPVNPLLRAPTELEQLRAEVATLKAELQVIRTSTEVKYHPDYNYFQKPGDEVVVIGDTPIIDRGDLNQPSILVETWPTTPEGRARRLGARAAFKARHGREPATRGEMRLGRQWALQAGSK